MIGTCKHIIAIYGYICFRYVVASSLSPSLIAQLIEIMNRILHSKKHDYLGRNENMSQINIASVVVHIKPA